MKSETGRGGRIMSIGRRSPNFLNAGKKVGERGLLDSRPVGKGESGGRNPV